MDYVFYVTDISLSNKFLYPMLPGSLSMFRVNRFSLSFYFDPRLHSSVFYGARVLLDQVLSKRFVATRMRRYSNFSSKNRVSQVVGATSTLSRDSSFDAVHLFLQYSLIRLSYGLLFVGPFHFSELNRYSIKTGFNRILFLFNLSSDASSLFPLYDMSFFGFDVCFGFPTENIYMNKVILSHYGYPIL